MLLARWADAYCADGWLNFDMPSVPEWCDRVRLHITWMDDCRLSEGESRPHIARHGLNGTVFGLLDTCRAKPPGPSLGDQGSRCTGCRIDVLNGSLSGGVAVLQNEVAFDPNKVGSIEEFVEALVGGRRPFRGATPHDLSGDTILDATAR